MLCIYIEKVCANVEGILSSIHDDLVRCCNPCIKLLHVHVHGLCGHEQNRKVHHLSFTTLSSIISFCCKTDVSFACRK